MCIIIISISQPVISTVVADMALKLGYLKAYQHCLFRTCFFEKASGPHNSGFPYSTCYKPGHACPSGMLSFFCRISWRIPSKC